MGCTGQSSPDRSKLHIWVRPQEVEWNACSLWAALSRKSRRAGCGDTAQLSFLHSLI